ncbi:sulfite exporter TauE/SafE family protein [Candidatus Woesebacteria bacterium]|nr:sulfite exporter TauE/SafE family protein [Candidatus Woesebacteria bacterium]
MQNIGLAFITGLTTGGISCLAVQGGLLASSMAETEEKVLTKLEKFSKVGAFLAAKLVAYTLLGLGLGALGSTLVLTPRLLGWMQIAAGIFMLGTAARLLNLHPIFRYFQIQPPKFIYRFIRKESKLDSSFTPLILGSSTVLIPCGVTQAMMALAVASANPLFGAAIMFAFTLGTSPVFFAMGMAAMELLKRKWFNYAAAAVIAILAMLSIEAGQTLKGSPIRLANFWKVLTTDEAGASRGVVAGVNAQGQQEVTINVRSNGYTTSTSALQKGVPVKLSLVTSNVQGCTRGFAIPSLNISKVLPQTGTETIVFTPTRTGTLAFSCNMGMYTGSFNVVERTNSKS